MQTWDMLGRCGCAMAPRIIPLEVPGIGVYECSDGHVYGYVGAPGGATWGDLLA